MDKSAIDAIAQLAVEHYASGGGDGYRAINDKQRLESIERFNKAPNFFRANFSTALVTEFSRYLNTVAGKATGLFIDHINNKAHAVIDMGNDLEPQWGKHRATLKLNATPDYTGLLDKADKGLSQRDFIDFVEDHLDCFTFYDDNAGQPNLLDTKATLAKLRRLKVDSNASTETNVGNFAQSVSAMESIEIKAAGTEAPPAGFKFTCKPFEDFAPFTAFCQLRAVITELNTGSRSEPDKITKVVQLKYRIVGLEALKQDIADELLNMLDEQIKVEGIQCYIGEMAYQ